MKKPEQDVYALASDQYGVFSRAQAVEKGLKTTQVDQRLRAGRFERVHPAVYRVAGSPVTGRQRAMAATLWLGDDAHTSFETAGALLRLDGFSEPDLHMVVPSEVRARVKGADVIVHRVPALPKQDRVIVDGIRCTSATRTIVDCAAMLRGEALELAFESARRMGLTSPRALAQRVGALCGPGKKGSTELRELLSHQTAGEPALQYRLEVKMARLLRTSPLPQPNRQVTVGAFRIDFALAPFFGVECEGFEYHGNRLQWKRDRRRTSWLESRGWRLLFVTWDDVTKRPDETLARIAVQLSSHSPVHARKNGSRANFQR